MLSTGWGLPTSEHTTNIRPLISYYSFASLKWIFSSFNFVIASFTIDTPPTTISFLASTLA